MDILYTTMHIRQGDSSIIPAISALKPLSVTNNSVGSRTATASQVGQNSSAYIARSGRSRTDAVICKGF